MLAAYEKQGTSASFRSEGKGYFCAIKDPSDKILYESPAARMHPQRAVRDNIISWLADKKLPGDAPLNSWADARNFVFLKIIAKQGEIHIVIAGLSEIAIVDKNGMLLSKGSPLDIQRLLREICNDLAKAPRSP